MSLPAVKCQCRACTDAIANSVAQSDQRKALVGPDIRSDVRMPCLVIRDAMLPLDRVLPRDLQGEVRTRCP